MQSIKNDEVRDYDVPQNELAAQVAFSYSGGTGYTSAPTISFSGGSGTGAAATAVITDGRLTDINITNQGSGYSGTPTIAFTGGGSTGAAATAIVAGEKVTGATITNSGNDRKITFTDQTTYGSDSRAAVHIEVFDKNGKSAVVKMASGQSSVVLDVIEHGLDPTGGLKATVTVVSAAGKRKNGSVEIASLANAGHFSIQS